MKLIHKIITLGITLVSGPTLAVHAQPAIETMTIAQMNSSVYNRGPDGFNSGNYNNRGPDGFNSGNYNNRGPGGPDQRDYRREIKDLNQTIRKNPKFVEAYNNRALARFVLGDKHGAIKDLQQAAELYLERGDKNKYEQTLLSIRDLQQ